MSYGNGHAQEGQLVPNSLTRYTPFGDYRTGEQSDITDRGFTGHKENDYIKLVDMNARWYAPAMGRFISPDTIVPSPTNPQTYNRYSYVNNNPLIFTDPSGHCVQYQGSDDDTEFTTCLDLWSQLGDAYWTLTRDSDLSIYPSEYMTELMQNGSIAEIQGVLDTIGSAAEAYQHARYEEMNRFSDCFHSSSGMHCPPVDGWAEYYPIPNGTWYIEVGFGPVAFDSRKNIPFLINIQGAGLVVCAGLCVGGEANIEIPLEDFAQSEHDLKFTRGMGFGSDVSIGNSNRYGYLIMIGHSSSSNGGNENFFRATAVDVSIEIGYEYE